MFPQSGALSAAEQILLIAECEGAGCETPESKPKVLTQVSEWNSAAWKENKMEQQRCSKLPREKNPLFTFVHFLSFM